MEKLGKKIVKFRIPIFIISILLLIPATIGYIKTRVNYDILCYLPGEIETMKGDRIFWWMNLEREHIPCLSAREWKIRM